MVKIMANGKTAYGRTVDSCQSCSDDDIGLLLFFLVVLDTFVYSPTCFRLVACPFQKIRPVERRRSRGLMEFYLRLPTMNGSKYLF